RLLVGSALPPAQRAQLVEWMLANTTGAARIRAGVPSDWKVADKTGTGDHGATNDLAVLWPPAGAPLALAVYFTQPAQDAKARSDV
ncbi:serine hydrolase, partial [Rhizobium johnstonii]|uniref:serine hydrolase n=1 Tax=Rhizobium johnstonii TaxID=3019933 RepID=UPI003F99BAC9